MKENINDLNDYLSLVLSNLDQIDDQNFDISSKNISLLINKIEDKRVYLKDNFDLTTLQQNCDVANRAVKQIFSRFDSIIESKKEQQQIISSELSKVVNKKKLINYQR